MMIEALESRIAPATVIVHSLGDVVSSINDAGAGDTVKFAHNLKGTVTIDTAFNIANDVKIIGNGKVTFQSDGSDRFFNFTQTETHVTLKKLVLQGGAAATGGAILSSADLTLIKCKLQGNTATGDGGAIEVEAGSVLAKGCKFINNQATNDAEGGAIYALSGTSVTVKKSLFQGNGATDGGAIADGNSASVTFTISHSRFVQNTATGEGGAIYSDGNDTITIKKSKFSENSAASYGALLASGNAIVKIGKTKFLNNSAAGAGGAIGLLDGTGVISHTLLKGNSAGTDGGGIYTTADSLILVKSRVIKNTASDTGGGIYDLGPESNLTVTKTKVKQNEAPNAPDIFHGQIVVIG